MTLAELETANLGALDEYFALVGSRMRKSPTALKALLAELSDNAVAYAEHCHRRGTADPAAAIAAAETARVAANERDNPAPQAIAERQQALSEVFGR